jgi:low affinity Fe/Cu permease
MGRTTKKAEAANGRDQRPQDPGQGHGSQGNLFSKYFSRFSHAIAHATGTPAAFLIAAATILVWAVTGPLFQYSDTWQLVINTGTTIVTFLMVFLIQNTQNRDTMALQLKLAELIIAMKGAKNSLATVEDLTEEELEDLHKELCARADATHEVLTSRRGRG